MRVVGLDPSLTSFGCARPEGVGLLRPPKGLGGAGRMIWLRDSVLELCRDADLVVVEGMSYGSGGRSIFDLGGLGWVLRVALTERGIPWVEASPSSLKKYATGKGNAGKELVLVEAVKRLSYTGSSYDEADALWLRMMALDYYGQPGAVQVPQAHRAGLSGVSWPAIDRKAVAR